MIAKGHDFPRVTLVGVLSADQALGLPDFRAAERTFQLLTQVAGRAGRGERPGRVVIQAFQPEHPLLKQAMTQDYEAFYDREIEYRRALRYPPQTALVELTILDRELGRAHGWGQQLAEELREAGRRAAADLGPRSGADRARSRPLPPADPGAVGGTAKARGSRRRGARGGRGRRSAASRSGRRRPALRAVSPPRRS